MGRDRHSILYLVPSAMPLLPWNSKGDSRKGHLLLYKRSCQPKMMEQESRRLCRATKSMAAQLCLLRVMLYQIR